MSITLIYDSLDNAVKELIEGSYLNNSEYQYSTAFDLGKWDDNTAWPKIITSTVVGSILDRKVQADLMVSILFIPKDLSSCRTKLEIDNRITKEAEFHKRALIEIYWWLIGRNKKNDGSTFRDYNYDGEAFFRTYYNMEGLTDEQKQLLPDDVVITTITIPLYDDNNKLCCYYFNP